MPLIGFAGAPFTVASYLVEGGPSRTYDAHQGADARRPGAVARSSWTGSPTWPSPRCAPRSTAGASAVQLFDTWAGALAPADYERFVLPAQPQGARRASPTSACPASTSASATGELLALMRDAGADVVGVDWRVPLDEARRAARRRRRPAGQPRPGAGASPGGSVVAEGVRDVLRRNGGHPGHVFNLGHGVLPETDPEVLERVVELVHAEGRADGHPPDWAPTARERRRRRSGWS